MTHAANHPPPLITPLVPAPDPADACARLSGLPHRAWLDSAIPHHHRGQYSFLGADPWTTVTADQRDPIAALRDALAPHRRDPAPDVPPFQGGAIGYFAYEFGRRLERLPSPRADDLGLPDIWFGLYDWAITWDHATARAWLISTGLPATGPAAARRARSRAGMVLDRLAARHPAPSHHPAGAAPAAPPGELPTEPVARLGYAVGSAMSEAAYHHAARQIRDYIAAGDVFQVNLTHRLAAPLPVNPLAFYRRLRRVNPAPFAAYLELGPWVVASASPERFVQVDWRGRVETCPIKGTRPRRADDPRADAALGAELLASEKDRAENVMIVDLLRNDLARVCAPGSVAVPELCALESFASVHHLVSTVVGQLVPGRDALDVITAAFPSGSITGAPKIRAMEIIREVEPVARGVYCGAIGYCSVTGTLDTSVAIRTCTIRSDRVFFGVGGGITADSDSALEYSETLDKARGIVNALAPA